MAEQDPATFGVPGPNRANVMVNNSMRGTTAQAASRGIVAAVRPTNITISIQERQAAQANASGIIDVEQIMTDDVNTLNPLKRTYRASVQLIVDYCREVDAAQIPDHIINDTLFPGLQKYQESFKVGSVAMVIRSEFYGYRLGRSKNYESLQAITNYLDLENADGRQRNLYVYHNNVVLPVVTYLFKYVLLNDFGFTRQHVLNVNAQSFKRSMLAVTGKRLGSPVWTERFFEQAIAYDDMKDKCNGHFFPFFLLMDQVIVGLADKYKSKRHWALPEEDVPGLIRANRNVRKYANSN